MNIEKFPQLHAGVKALGEVMGGEQVVAVIPKNATQEIRISFRIYKDNPLVDIRTFMKFKGNEDFTPTKKGVTLKVEQFPYLLEAVNKLAEAVEKYSQAK